MPYFQAILGIVLIIGLASAFSKTLNNGGAASFSTAAYASPGMVEAQLVLFPHLQTMIRSNLFIVMTGAIAGLLFW